MNLSHLFTTTTVEFSQQYRQDTVVIDGTNERREAERVVGFLDQVRHRSGSASFARVESVNNFDKSAGLASSASGFAALTVAATSAAGLMLSEKELSIMARLGSGSACRSIPAGFVEWKKGRSSATSYAETLFPADHWRLLDIAVMVGAGAKKIPTSAGQRLVWTSPFFRTRLAGMDNKNTRLKSYIKTRDFPRFGELIETEALELHTVMMTSAPPLFYWSPKTVEIIQAVWRWRQEGLPVYFTIDAGASVHLICQPTGQIAVKTKLKQIGLINYVVNYPTGGTRLTDHHLF